jgi:hypothetical protein
MKTAQYQVTIELKNGAQWVEEIWAEYQDQAEVRAFEFCKGAGQNPISIISTKVIARS